MGAPLNPSRVPLSSLPLGLAWMLCAPQSEAGVVEWCGTRRNKLAEAVTIPRPMSTQESDAFAAGTILRIIMGSGVSADG